MDETNDIPLQYWLDQANRGGTFVFDPDDISHGPNGEPYLRLPLAVEADGEGTRDRAVTFRDLALYLYEHRIGAVLCFDGWDWSDSGTDFFLVYFGDVVDFLTTGHLHEREPHTLGWGLPDEYPTGFVGMEMTAPDMLILPRGIRQNIAWLLSQIGVDVPMVSLLKVADGRKALTFNVYGGQPLDAADAEYIGWRLMWYLPRYFAVFFIEGDGLAQFPLLPGPKES